MNSRVFFLTIWLNAKRLLKRKLFIAMLAVLFISAFALGRIAEKTEGIVTAAVFCPGHDAAAEEVIGRLKEEKKIFRIKECETEQQAFDEVDSARADTAWILPADLSEKVREFTASEVRRNPIITVYQREDNSALRLARERLFSIIYPELSYSLFERFVTLRLSDAGADIPEEGVLYDFYNAGEVSGSIVEHKTLAEVSGGEKPEKDAAPQISENTASDKGAAESASSSSSYLLSPVRGMMALIIMLCMLAAAMYCRKDRETGLSAVIPGRGKGMAVLCYLIPAGLISAAAAIIALYAAGTAGQPLRETLAMLLLLAMSLAFCLLLYFIFPKSDQLASALPFIVLLVLLQCPIFLDIPSLQPLRTVLPPYYYIRVCAGALL